MRDDELMHYGRGHLDGGHSGRWPWGSKKNKGITNNTKKVTDMSDEELRSLVNRLQLEKSYYDSKAAINKHTAVKPGVVSRFFKSVGNDVLISSVKTASKDLLTSYLKKKGSEMLKIKIESSKKDDK